MRIGRITTSIIGALVLIAVPVIGCMACTNISPGHVGVRVNKCSGGGVDQAPVSVGYHGVGPCVDIYEFPTFQQTLILTKSPHEGSKNDDSITVTSSEGLPINVDSSMSFTINEARAPHIYQKFRNDLIHIQQSYMRQTVREALQEVFSKYSAQQLYSDKRELSRAEAQGILAKKFDQDGFLVTQFTLNETRVPEAVTAAINAKVAMVQQAQRAEQEVKKIEAEARQKVAQAEGETKAKRLYADAQAYANEKQAQSLTPALIEWTRLQKWDGHLPQVTGGNPFVSLGTNPVPAGAAGPKK
jgi:regulator of protease activity HflC (stomatin/prohibitin superfamily)